MATVVTGVRLVERERELELLGRAWRAARAGRGAAWLVCAEAGGGKTRLLREATRAAPVRWGTAEPVTPPDPYLAVMQALPGFRPTPRRADSVARAVESLERLAGDGPIMLVLDDLHFADEGTVAVFVRLAALCPARPWLILGALRPGEGPEALRLAATELVGQGQAHRLDLPPLSREGVATLAAGVRGRAATAVEVDAVFADSGGNPWFAETLVRGAGAMSAARDRILLRLDRLDRAIPGARDLLAALTPAGEPLPHPVVAALGGGDGPALRRVLQGLRDAAVLRERDGAWQFRHELLRRSLLEDMLEADRRDAHRRLAEALAPGRGLEGIPPYEQYGSAAALAMHYAAAGDARAGEWALRAAREASDLDAHAEALAQLERALRVPLDPEARRTALRAAAQGAWNLGRFAESRRHAEAAIAIPGGEPQALSWLHLHAAESALPDGEWTAGDAHMEAAERALAGQPVSAQMVRVAVARVLQIAVRIEPERAATAADRAVRLARALGDREAGTGYELEARCYGGLALLNAGDPAGLAPFEAMREFAAARPQLARDIVRIWSFAYAAAVRSLFHAGADRFRDWLFERMQRHNLEWAAGVGPYHILDLVQRSAFAAARARMETASTPPAHAIAHTVLLCARVLYEARTGSPPRARTLLAAAHPPDAFAHTALLDLARLEVETWTEGEATAAPAPDIYAQAEGRRYARVAGVAAVALVRAGGRAPSWPEWLAAASPLGVFWDWAGSIQRRDAPALRSVAARLEAMDCPYEAALALRDAGDLQEAYRALRALGATPAREQVARLLRAASQPIPRGTRVAGHLTTLTDTERAVCRLVTGGATNEAAAAALGIGVRTVEAHLSRIYQKTGRQGRTALASWWTEQERGHAADPGSSRA